MFKFWKRKPAVVPESFEEATSDADLFAVARGAGVLAQEQQTSEALIAYQRDGDADDAMRIFRGAA